MKYILPNAPEFNRFFDPFVGGGSVFMGIQAKEYYINDLCSELVDLYSYIATSDEQFFNYAEAMDQSWQNACYFFHNNLELVDIYCNYRAGITNIDELKSCIHSFCLSNKEYILHILAHLMRDMPCVLPKEIEKNLYRKMIRMRELEIAKHLLPEKDLYDNIETAIKSAVYMNYRSLYNDKQIATDNRALHCALFFFMRNYAYSGMFRYSSKGFFNVPYGGIAYNSKLLAKKLNYYRSLPVLNHFAKTKIFNLDFEDFLNKVQPNENDFLFLAPPYDSEFNTYAQNVFTRADQVRLADYLINKCKAKWLLIIKNTEFIYNLYNHSKLNIRTFDKEYLVSFMNRNDKKVTHLLITNY